MLHNPRHVRPMRDWALVLAEQRRKQVGALYLAIETGAEKVTEGCGRVIRLGPGERAKALDLSEGDRITYRTFLKYATPVETEERWPDSEPKTYFLMSIDDIMGIAAEGADIGIYSRPGMTINPEETDQAEV